MRHDDLIGSSLGGCEILEVIGHGGMGIIFKARQKSLDRVVAVKVLAPKLACDLTFVTRFQREARAIARVNHPNILAVYDVGNEDEFHYMIMELIEGESLAELQSRMGGPLKTDDALNYILQAAQGLEAAHACGIVHRDIKPENLMLTRKGSIKVSDFGLAKDADTSTTATEAVMGTPAFMSPEQCDGKKVDERTDIYSLGGTFYKLVTGRLPFEAETAMSMMYRHKHEALVPPREVVPSIPEPISAIMVKMLAKKREKRFQSMTELISELENCMRGRALTPEPVREAPRFGNIPDESMPLPPIPAGPELYSPGSSHAQDRVEQTGIYDRDARASSSSDRLRALGRPLETMTGASAHATLAGTLPAGRDDSFGLALRGDELISRGDRLGGLKCYRQALKSPSLDSATRRRLEETIGKELSLRRKNALSLQQRSMLVEASREYRTIVDLAPDDKESVAALKELEHKLAMKRTLVNDIRTAIGALQFEAAIQAWDRTPPDLRDESLSKQIEHLRNVVVPSLKLCEQGERYNEEGRLEEAIATFEDALRMDDNCERARQGLGEAQGKLQRIGTMLKEGYELILKQDYQDGIQTLKNILRLQPQHLQAIKSIIDAYLAMAQRARSEGNLKFALSAYVDAKRVDPQNRNVQRLHDEIAMAYEKEQALIDRANEAAARNNRSLAIRYWNEVLRINPANRDAGPAIEQLRKNRSSLLYKTIAIGTVTLVLAACALQFLFEYVGRQEIVRLIDDEQYDQALARMDGIRFIFYENEIPGLRSQANIEVLQKQAQFEEAEGKLELAAATLERILPIVPEQDRVLVQRKSTLLAAQAFHLEAETAIEEAAWSTATAALQRGLQKIKLSAVSSPELEALKDRLTRNKVFVDLVQRATELKATGQLTEAIREFKQAARLRPEIPYVAQVLTELGYRPEEFNERMAQAGILLAQPWLPDALDQAQAQLDLANKADAGNPRLEHITRYAADMRFCQNEGMVLFNRSNPEDPHLNWTSSERKAGFCIDRYEFPNKAGAIPRSDLTWLEAKGLCEFIGKRLCTYKEWKDGCMGKAYVSTWPFGMEPIPDGCNWNGNALVGSGQFSKCYNSLGAFDMTGNVSEWTLDGSDEYRAYLAGGSFEQGPLQARCLDKQAELKDRFKAPSAGFRCCKSLKD